MHPLQAYAVAVACVMWRDELLGDGKAAGAAGEARR